MRIYEDHVSFGPLDKIGWLSHCFTTRAFRYTDGAGTAGRDVMVERVLSRFFPAAVSGVWGEQVHGNGVVCVSDEGCARVEFPRTDALTTRTRGICLLAFGADCPLVFVVDMRLKAVGLVHSGRRGTEAGVVGRCVDTMTERFGSSPRDMLVLVSPSIGPCCYPVDLWASIARQAAACGIGKIYNPRLCTACRNDIFFSYRRERDAAGRMIAACMIG
jgi:copper oxidase (laccase) domain-containing protein